MANTILSKSDQLLISCVLYSLSLGLHFLMIFQFSTSLSAPAACARRTPGVGESPAPAYAPRLPRPHVPACNHPDQSHGRDTNARSPNFWIPVREPADPRRREVRGVRGNSRLARGQ